ncbi:O-antigen ligase family protein [uncultured Cloacibacillus sp.]|uniref:O-antigen ligase family protein n=1 Tax=uncultured Cloacibacillus sp. TaxID=889794 RepID=UPI0027D9A381|nr:O-antigen ligase family protein [uncultured Cloacibacillus sp.]
MVRYKSHMLMLFNKICGAEYNKFRLGQILFIIAVTFGLYLGDTARRILMIGALFCLTKVQIKEKFYEDWDKEQKTTGYIFLALWLWVFFIPLFLGIDPILERLRSTEWCIELFIFMWSTMMFAKDAFFINNFRRSAIAACALYSIIAMLQRYLLDFVVDFSNWPFGLGAWSVGTILSVLLPWVLYDLIVQKSLWKKGCLLFVFIISSLTLFFTLYTTFWLVFCVQIAVALAMVLIFSKGNFFRIFISLTAIMAIGALSVYGASFRYQNIYRGFGEQVDQIFFSGHDIQKFTSRRYSIWSDAVKVIKLRPIQGYGWAEFADYNPEHINHTHSAFLQAAWTAGWPAMLLLIAFLLRLLYLCVVFMKRKNKMSVIPFIVVLVIFTYMSCGMLDDMFRAKRRIVTLYWVSYMLMFTPLVKDEKYSVSKFDNQ